ncbi:hypothetical protein [Ferrovibrio sp.]|uniref:hypothetical protein n=1 Tax=Ferrovibrio sp. TaxID=1917215 RepID=UPI003D13936D
MQWLLGFVAGFGVAGGIAAWASTTCCALVGDPVRSPIIKWLFDWQSAWSGFSAGFLALFAALLTIRQTRKSAREQIDQAKEEVNVLKAVADEERARHRREVAGAIWAILHQIRMVIGRMQRELQITRVTYTTMLPIKRIDTSLYQSIGTNLGTLPPELSAAVARSFGHVFAINERVEKLLGHSPQAQCSIDYPTSLAHEFGACLTDIDFALNRLEILAKNQGEEFTFPRAPGQAIENDENSHS